MQTDMQTYARELLAEKGAAMPESAFVFMMHQGYQFLFFDTKEGDDPPVFLFDERDSSPRKIFEHFTEWALVEAKDEIAIKNRPL